MEERLILTDDHDTTRLQVLILEDSPDDAELIRRELTKSSYPYATTVVDSKEEFTRALNELSPDIILSDHSLPDFNSFEALELCKEYRGKVGEPVVFILVTGNFSEEFAIQCISAGADDYILKDRLKRLHLSIITNLEKKRMEMERSRHLEQVIEKEKLMREAERIARFGSWQVELESNAVIWSDETFRIYGYSPGEIIPSYELFRNHVANESRHVLKWAIEQVQYREDLEFEMKIVDTKGSQKDLRVKLVVHRGQNGVPERITGFNLDITREKQTRDELLRSQQNYKSLFDQNPDLVYSLDLEGNFTNVNDSVVKFTEIPGERMLNNNFAPFICETDLPRVQEHFRKATLGQPQHYEARCRSTSGKEALLRITNIPVMIDNKIEGVHGIAKNVTEERRLENLLHRVNTLARIGGWEIDYRKQTLNWTTITRQIHEVPEDFTPDMDSMVRFIARDDGRLAIRQALRLAIAHGTPWDLELEITTMRGMTKWVRIIGEAEFANGACIRLYGSIQDVHEHRKAEQDLTAALMEKERILESIGDSFFAVDHQWTVTYWNKNAEKTVGLAARDIVGKNLWDVFTDPDTAVYRRYFERAWRNLKPVRFTAYYPPLQIWSDACVYPSETGLSIYFRDITEMVDHKKSLEEHARSLREIAWIQSHQVRAPLSRVLGLINLLRLQNLLLNEEGRNILAMIVQSGEELEEIVRNVVRKAEDPDRTIHYYNR
jgi:PAS domain S-box-containing protein